MPGGFCGLYRNTRGARVARGEIKPDDESTAEEMARTLRSEARKVKHYLRVHEKGFRIRTLAGFDAKEEAQVRRWLDMLARNLDMDAETLEEHGNTRHAEEDPRAQGRHRGGGRPAGHVAVPNE